MRRLRARLERLARGQGEPECPVCPRHARIRFYEVAEGEPKPGPIGPCPACGKVPEGITHIVVLLPNNGRDDDRRAS